MSVTLCSVMVHDSVNLVRLRCSIMFALELKGWLDLDYVIDLHKIHVTFAENEPFHMDN